MSPKRYNIDNDIIQLSCPRYDCIEITQCATIEVKIKDYVYGKLKCPICGSPLNTVQENTIQHQLIALGIIDI
jgi:hypothetical protein